MCWNQQPQHRRPKTEGQVYSIFVYGTLREGCSNWKHLLKGRAERIATGWTHGIMYSMGGHPGVVFQEGSNKIVGEIFEVSPEVLHDLDRLEGHVEGFPDQSGYYRIPVTVHITGGSTHKGTIEAEAYRVHQGMVRY